MISFKFKYWLTFSILLWENLCRAAMPLTFIAVFSISIVLLGAPGLFIGGLGPWSQLIVLVPIYIALFYGLKLAGGSFTFPTSEKIKRRLEHWSGLDHRPLDILDDFPSDTENLLSNRLWVIHKEIVKEQVVKLKVGWPRSIVSEMDSFGVRAGLGILLIFSLCVSWQQKEERLYAGIFPNVFSQVEYADIEFDLWVNPPSYTKRLPFTVNDAVTQIKKNKITYSREKREPIVMPAGSLLGGNIYGMAGPLELVQIKKTGEISSLKMLKAISKNQYNIEYKPSNSEKIELRNGSVTVAKFETLLVSDQAPTIFFERNPKVFNERLHFQYRSTDDYGVAEISTLIRKANAGSNETSYKEVAIKLGPPLDEPKAFTGREELDLIAHKWAGQFVNISLVVNDHIGQTGTSELVNIRLPERIFDHPVASELQKMRLRLFEKETLSPQSRENIEKFIQAPELFGLDFGAFLNLRTIYLRLSQTGSWKDKHLPALLWKLANYLEDGNSSKLFEKITSLEKLIKQSASGSKSNDELEQAWTELSRQLTRFVETMGVSSVEERQRAGNTAKDVRSIYSSDMNETLQNIYDLMKSGSNQSAREMLSHLRDIIKGLRKKQSVEQRPSIKNIKELEKLTNNQQSLMDKISFQNSNSQDNSVHKRGKIIDAQKKLAEQINNLIKRLGKNQNSEAAGLYQALTQVNRAIEALVQQNFADVLNAQNRAINALTKTLEQIVGGWDSTWGSGLDSRAPNSRYSIPRALRGKSDDYPGSGKIKMLQGDVIKKSKIILQKIRRRREQVDRPAAELDYLERLLERF